MIGASPVRREQTSTIILETVCGCEAQATHQRRVGDPSSSSAPPTPDPSSPPRLAASCVLAPPLVSISMAYRLSNPLIRMGSLLNFCEKASDTLWAGSVLMISTLPRVRASSTPMLELDVVLPTPPLPPTKIHFSDSCSTRLRSDGSSSSSSSSESEYSEEEEAPASAAICDTRRREQIAQFIIYYKVITKGAPRYIR